MASEQFDAVLAEALSRHELFDSELTSFLDRLAAAHAAEAAELRETNRCMNRRVQMAEAAVPSYRKLIAIPPDGDGVRFADGNFGRKLLAWYCEQLTERAEAAERDARQAVGLLRECEDAVYGKELWERIRAFLAEHAIVSPPRTPPMPDTIATLTRGEQI